MLQPGLRTALVLLNQSLTDSGEEFGLQWNDSGKPLDGLGGGGG